MRRRDRARSRCGLANGAVAIALLAAAAPAAGQAPIPLVDAARRALETHPTARAAEAAVDAAAARRAAARSEWWPRLSLDASATRFQEPMLIVPLHGLDAALLSDPPEFDESIVEAVVGARWTLFDGGARGARTAAAGAGLEAARAGQEAAHAALLAAVVDAYLDVVVGSEILAAHDARMQALAGERDRVALAVREGAAAGVDRTRVDAALARGRADRVDAAAALEVAGGDLGRLIGVDAPPAALAAAVVPPRAPVSPDPPEGAEPPVVVAPPEVERARAEARVAEALADAARGAWLPTVSATGAFVERGSPEADEWAGEWQAGLALRYALFSGGARRAEVDRAAAEAVAARAEARRVELEAQAAAQRADAALARARARAEALEAAVTSLEEVARVEALSLAEGAGVEADWLDAEADLLEARAALAETRAAALQAEVAAARAAGTLTLDWLASRLEETP